jgi:large conductance mechanosensitive channel
VVHPEPDKKNSEAIPMSVVQEFKEFAVKGNVVDMAVGIVIGGAFGKIVSSFVGDVLMPPLGVLMGGVDFTAFRITLKEGVDKVPPVTLNYGTFIQTLINFLIIAVAIFLFVKMVNRIKRKAEEAPPAPPAPSNEEVLLGEIRDLLKRRS